MIQLMVGLGNPGSEYEATRHNAGFWFIDAVASRLGAVLRPERSYFGCIARANTPSGQVWLLEPMTFMNLSGKSVAAVARFFKIPTDRILVAHDELDILPGYAKLKFGGSHAGHNGLRDIQAQLGTPDFWRLRLGIGHPGVKSEVVDYVLRRPPLSEREGVDKAIDQSLGALDSILSGEMEQAVRKIHASTPRPKAAKPIPPSEAPDDATRAAPAGGSKH